MLFVLKAISGDSFECKTTIHILLKGTRFPYYKPIVGTHFSMFRCFFQKNRLVFLRKSSSVEGPLKRTCAFGKESARGFEDLSNWEGKMFGQVFLKVLSKKADLFEKCIALTNNA